MTCCYKILQFLKDNFYMLATNHLNEINLNKRTVRLVNVLNCSVVR